jgi:hypothetical protein
MKSVSICILVAAGIGSLSAHAQVDNRLLANE